MIKCLPTVCSQFQQSEDAAATQMQERGTESQFHIVCPCMLYFLLCVDVILLTPSMELSLEHLCIHKSDNVKWLFMDMYQEMRGLMTYKKRLRKVIYPRGMFPISDKHHHTKSRDTPPNPCRPQSFVSNATLIVY